jgi:hypothetical protein
VAARHDVKIILCTQEAHQAIQNHGMAVSDDDPDATHRLSLDAPPKPLVIFLSILEHRTYLLNAPNYEKMPSRKLPCGAPLMVANVFASNQRSDV